MRCTRMSGTPAARCSGGMRNFAALELGVAGKGVEPYLRGICQLPDRSPRVGEEQPPPAVLVRENLWSHVGRTRCDTGGQARLEGLHGGALLEPHPSALHR